MGNHLGRANFGRAQRHRALFTESSGQYRAYIKPFAEKPETHK